MKQIVDTLPAWLDRVDPGAHRRIKGLRLVTAYGLALALATLNTLTSSVPPTVPLGMLAAGFALWASVSEARATRAASSRDLAALCVAAAAGATLYALLCPWLDTHARVGGEWILISGAFLAPWLKRYGVLGAGIGSQLYIGQLLAYGAHLGPSDLPAIGVAALIAMVAAIVPRVLSGPSEQPALAPPAPVAMPARNGRITPEFAMGLQAAAAALVVIALNSAFDLTESAWAITACVYVVTQTAEGTVERVRRRIVGTLIGVPLGLACLPIAAHAPLAIWVAASVAMIVYAMALPERYDIACGAFAFTLIVTLAASGEHSVAFLVARAWETIVGGLLGVVMAWVVLPLKTPHVAHVRGAVPRESS
ncbi:FUSC family protein [Pararobbsia silviterrae]|uniref:FUSC family protein n=1 Tax=Pararobbsia silviterrae TaxID=1792498 RepID=A0A494XGC8_9BURK|nr:FUSC family protein [Pararobbsia silviterrae]RKP49710.1 FUSC family protein [Pararobbsia silviterrae]